MIDGPETAIGDQGLCEGPAGVAPTTPGLEVRDPFDELTAEGRQELPASARDGVMVDQSQPRSPASKAGGRPSAALAMRAL